MLTLPSVQRRRRSRFHRETPFLAEFTTEIRRERRQEKHSTEKFVHPSGGGERLVTGVMTKYKEARGKDSEEERGKKTESRRWAGQHEGEKGGVSG